MNALNYSNLAMATENAIGPSEVLFVTEATSWGERGYDEVKAVFSSVVPVFWSTGMPKPDLSGWSGDWIICFKADLVLSRGVLDRAAKGAINFHPSSPKYRGLGGYWWAIHNGDKTFGTTVHHMDEQIDHGDIIKTNTFPISAGETEKSLKEKTAAHSVALLRQILGDIQSGKPLVPCGVQWEPRLYTAKGLVQAQRAYESGAKAACDNMTTIHDGIANLSEAKAKTPQADYAEKLALD